MIFEFDEYVFALFDTETPKVACVIFKKTGEPPPKHQVFVDTVSIELRIINHLDKELGFYYESLITMESIKLVEKYDIAMKVFRKTYNVDAKASSTTTDEGTEHEELSSDGEITHQPKEVQPEPDTDQHSA